MVDVVGVVQSAEVSLVRCCILWVSWIQVECGWGVRVGGFCVRAVGSH